MADFQKIVRDVLEWEGVRFNADRTALDPAARNPSGYVDDPRDPGGETNFGLSKRANPDLDMKALTLERAIARYEERYWAPHGLGALADPWALFLFDAYVQHNPRAVDDLRRFNRLSDAMWARLRYYASLRTFSVFGAGWIRRMADLRDRLWDDYGVEA